jgi:hypothetical protein
VQLAVQGEGFEDQKIEGSGGNFIAVQFGVPRAKLSGIERLCKRRYSWHRQTMSSTTGE